MISKEIFGQHKMPASPSKDRLKNVTNVLAHLLDDYDIRLRPDFGGRKFKLNFNIRTKE